MNTIQLFILHQLMKSQWKMKISSKKRLRKKNIDCQHCDKKFSSDFQLNIHYKLGNGVPIQCGKCNFKACTPRGLDIHDKNCKKIESIDNDSNQMSEKHIKRKKR